MSSVKIGVLISGSGTNLQAVIDHIQRGKINGEIGVVISNKPGVFGLERARQNDIDAIYIDRKAYGDDDYNKKIIKELKKRDIQLVVLAGYLKILSEAFVTEFKNRIINIHPSLIPSFCGKGFYGEKVHRAVLDYGVKVTGATVHFVDGGTDTGPIILQQSVEVEEEETFETLKDKVLKIEHTILPQAIKLYCEGRLEVEGRRVKILD